MVLGNLFMSEGGQLVIHLLIHRLQRGLLLLEEEVSHLEDLLLHLDLLSLQRSMMLFAQCVVLLRGTLFEASGEDPLFLVHDDATDIPGELAV